MRSLPAQDGSPATDERADFCIIGTGPAGLAIAQRLAATGRRICLVESGGKRPTGAHQELNDAVVTGLSYDCRESRARAFGGTTHLWAGRCGTLDPIDYRARAWVPDSGWPLSPEDLRGAYRDAFRFLRAHDPAYFETGGKLPEALAELGDDLLLKDFLVLDHVDGTFGGRVRRQLAARSNISILTGWTVTELLTDENEVVVAAQARATDGSGGVRRIEAATFVVAAGGLETPRLLLASRGRHAAGIGNGHDLVGRYFSDHPRMRSSSFLLPTRASFDTASLMQRDHRKSRIGFRFEEGFQERHGLLNNCLFFDRHNGDIESLATSMLSHEAMKAQTNAGKEKSASYVALRAAWRGMPPSLRRGLDTALRARRSAKYVLTMKIELQPNPDSRITLGTEVDRLGMPKLVLDWKVTRDDRDSIRRYFACIKTRIEPIGLMDKVLLLPDPDDDIFYQDSSHPSGTTRMAASPRKGVVDADLKVHGVPNLYICGSAVFPTYGNVNPTATIVALAFRLADHLAGAAGDTRLSVRSAA